MANRVKFSENFSISDSIQGVNSKVKDHITNMIKDSSKGDSKITLLTEAAVTHAGIVNANLGFYKPEKLRNSVGTWTQPFEKPVLVDHNSSQDPIGRVLGSIYKTTVPGMSPKLKNSVYNTDYSYRGLGYIQNLLNVADAAAVEKVLDGRYLTLSVSGDNDEMTCSICDHDWANEGKCKHRFGNYYTNDRTGEDELAYWIAGNFIWDEVSFVNAPADPFAKVLNKEVTQGEQAEVLSTYDYKECTTLEGPVIDSAKRFLKFYAINDSKGKMVEINDATNISALYKIYDAKLTPVGISLKPAKEPNTVADNIVAKPEEAVAAAAAVVPPAAEAAVKVEDKVVAPAAAVVAPAPAAEAVVAPVKVEDAKVTAVAEPVAAAKVEDAKITDEKITTAVADAVKPLNDKIKTLEDAAKVLDAEKKTINDQVTNLQVEIRNMIIDRVMELKDEAGTKYADEAEKNQAKLELAARALDSLKDQIKDLKETIKKAKHPGPAEIKIGDSGESVEKSDVEKIQDELSKMPLEKLIAAKFNGKFNPAVNK